MINRLEALTDAFMVMNGTHDPTSVAYKNRNPLLLKAFIPKHTADENGYRIFKSLVSGYDNGKLDLIIKCSGKSRSGLTPQSTLLELVKVYDNPTTASKYVVNFLRRSLNDDSITDRQPLNWFLEK